MPKRTCKSEGCMLEPFYNFKGETKRIFCKNHKEENMVNNKQKICIKEGCITEASYNYEGESKKLFCKRHKEGSMVKINYKKCEKEGCKTIPSYNYEGETKGRFCVIHKEENMVYIIHKKCEKERCKTIPYYNYEGETKGRFCVIHKEENMIDVITKLCEKEGCKSKAVFNKEGETKRLYCSKHKEADMLNVKSKNCIYDNCKTICTFGYCGQKPSHCAKHKLDYMITKSKRTCIGNDEEDCKDMAIYGKDEPLHCEDHKLSDEICWLVKKCNNCGRDKELLNKYSLCGICADVPFYEESKRLNKMKESKMVKYLRENIKDLREILVDKIIDSTCNLYRPDILYDCGTHIVVIECDENQHKRYNWESCSLNRSLEHMEEKRMYEIMIAYGLPTIFLRWNPDNFKVKNNKKYSIDKRLEILVMWVNYSMKMEVTEGVIYKKLFYDEYEEGDMSFKNINGNDLL